LSSPIPSSNNHLRGGTRFGGTSFSELSDEENTDIVDKIVSLKDNKGRDIALGVIREKQNSNVLILSPFDNTCEISQVIVGFCNWQP
jgi:polynucleotide 5'-kinase involved in rRNA processing